MMNELSTFIKNEISPLLQQHHGDIKVTDLKDGVLRFRLTGQCSNCPSSKYTIEEIIEKRIKEAFPEIKEIALETGVSDELLNMARTMLSKKRN